MPAIRKTKLFDCPYSNHLPHHVWENKLKKCLLFIFALLLLQACTGVTPPDSTAASRYLDNNGRDDALSGGVRMIPIKTPKGNFNV